MTLLVVGASGQLASHLRQRLPQAVFRGREALDLTDTAAIEPAVRAINPAVIINAAAYTAVDAAESEPDTAWQLNAEAPAALARAAAAVGAVLVHISTDYVFDGNAEDAYPADAATRPINVYGRSKLAGELAVATLCQRHWILRASWVFSEFGSNFVRTMLRVGAERDVLKVVADQFGRPTYAGDLAVVIERLTQLTQDNGPEWGVYNAVGGRVVSWYEFAGEIFQGASERGLLGTTPTVQAIPTADYPTPATRPLRAVLEPSAALRTATGFEPDWHTGLGQTLDRLGAG